jgi:dihydrofolate synthase/folylpolyglutamate synthase
MTAYQAALNYLYSRTNYGNKRDHTNDPNRFDLGRVRQALVLLGNPHQAFQSIHIAGTKGKGSTAAMTAAILRQAGYRTGLYTSPHLHTFRERIQVNGKLIPQVDVIAGVDALQPIADQVPRLTTFELITLLAFDYFARHKIEWAVLEVGMGGRLDATNVVTPAISAITSISYDHMMYLGDTLAQIAAEKAGIIKPGVPVVSSLQETQAAAVIQRAAAEKNAPLIRIGCDWHWQSIASSTREQQFAVWTADAPNRKQVYKLPLLGQHQQSNATTVLALVAQLQASGVTIPDAAVQTGLRNVQWPGRLEILGRKPWVIVDAAHNGDSMGKLVATIEQLFSYKHMILILGTSIDKDVDRMLHAVRPVADQVLVTQATHPRAADPTQLADRAHEYGLQATSVPLDRALDTALNMADKDDLILATGSLFLVADLSIAWYKHKQQPLPPMDVE